MATPYSSPGPDRSIDCSLEGPADRVTDLPHDANALSILLFMKRRAAIRCQGWLEALTSPSACRINVVNAKRHLLLLLRRRDFQKTNRHDDGAEEACTTLKSVILAAILTPAICPSV
jgi:hypothetical protein